MSLTIEAIYEDGVLKLTQAIALPEGTHVSAVIAPTETAVAAKTPAEILAEIAALPMAPNNQNFLTAIMTPYCIPLDAHHDS